MADLANKQLSKLESLQNPAARVSHESSCFEFISHETKNVESPDL